MNELDIISFEKPFIPGTLEERYNKNKKGEEYGPYFRLSYNLKGKNSSMFVKKENAEQIKEFVGNYKKLREYTMEEGIKNLELLQKKGIEAFLNKYKYSNLPPGSEPKSVQLSRDNWKSKALKRQEVLAKQKVTIRDLKKSRENWKHKFLDQMEITGKLQEENPKEIKKN
jgi:hypothetical protein